MEPDIRQFLLRIVQGISMTMLWLLINMTVGIYWGFAFFDNRPSAGNYIYYAAMAISFFFLLKYLGKKWRGEQ